MCFKINRRHKIFKYGSISIVLIPVFILTNLIPAISVSTQEPVAFGEMNATGNVKVLSSTGQWIDMKGAYPLLKETKLRIADGTVSITTKRGSKIDLLQGTEVAITVANSTYTVDILNCTGNVSFNMAPPEFITVSTPETTRVIVQKNDVPGLNNVRGVVLNKEKGTEVKSLLGKFYVGHHGFKPRVLNTGESVFVGGECTVLAVAPGEKTAMIITGALFITGGVLFATQDFRKDRVATPSGF